MKKLIAIGLVICLSSPAFSFTALGRYRKRKPQTECTTPGFLNFFRGGIGRNREAPELADIEYHAGVGNLDKVVTISNLDEVPNIVADTEDGQPHQVRSVNIRVVTVDHAADTLNMQGITCTPDEACSIVAALEGLKAENEGEDITKWTSKTTELDDEAYAPPVDEGRTRWLDECHVLEDLPKRNEHFRRVNRVFEALRERVFHRWHNGRQIFPRGLGTECVVDPGNDANLGYSTHNDRNFKSRLMNVFHINALMPDDPTYSRPPVLSLAPSHRLIYPNGVENPIHVRRGGKVHSVDFDR